MTMVRQRFGRTAIGGGGSEQASSAFPEARPRHRHRLRRVAVTLRQPAGR